MPRPHHSHLVDSEHIDPSPVIPADPLDLRVNLAAMIHWADSTAFRRKMMADIGFPSDDVQMFLVVNQLTYRGAMRPTDIADGIQTGRANVTKIVTRLVETGLVVRIADPDDDRAVLIALTPLGRELGERISATGETQLQQAFSSWDGDDVELLKILIARLAVSMNTPNLSR